MDEKAAENRFFFLLKLQAFFFLAIWGYSSGRTIWSDLVFISVNTIVYSTLIILFLWGLRRLRLHQSA
jgi:hypothetical protein